LTGAPTHRAPKNDWALPKPNSYVADAVRLACDKTFKGPFAAIAAHASAARPDLKTVVKSVPEAMSSERGPALRSREPLAAAYAVQIGAYSTPRGSDEAWRALQSALPDKTHGLSKATTPVRAGGRTLYRTVVKGFASIEAAAAFCRVLQTSGRPCLIVGAGGP
jgi:hypothetical protein